MGHAPLFYHTPHSETPVTPHVRPLDHTPPHFPTHNKHGNTRQKRNGNDTRGTDNVKGNRQCKVPDPTRTRGNTQPTAPRHSTGPPREQKGDTNTQTGDANIRRGVSNTAALPSPCHPPPQRHPTIRDGPTHHQREGGAHRGYPTTRTVQTHTHHPHTTHPARNSARHDSSTRQHCNGMSRARAAPPHWAGQQQHTPPPFTHREGWTPSTHLAHLLSLIHVHTTDDQR